MSESDPSIIYFTDIRTQPIATGSPADTAMQDELSRFLGRDDLRHYQVSLGDDTIPDPDNPSRDSHEYVIFAWYSSYQERWNITVLAVQTANDDAVAAACIASRKETVMPRSMLWMAVTAVADLTNYQAPIVILAPESDDPMPNHVDIAADEDQLADLRNAIAVGLGIAPDRDLRNQT